MLTVTFDLNINRDHLLVMNKLPAKYGKGQSDKLFTLSLVFDLTASIYNGVTNW